MGAIGVSSNISNLENSPGQISLIYHLGPGSYESKTTDNLSPKLHKQRFEALTRQPINKLKAGAPSIPCIYIYIYIYNLVQYIKTTGASVGQYNPDYNSVKSKQSSLPFPRVSKAVIEGTKNQSNSLLEGLNSRTTTGINNIYNKHKMNLLLDQFKGSMKTSFKEQAMKNLEKELEMIENARWGEDKNQCSYVFKSNTKKGGTFEGKLGEEVPGPGHYRNINNNEIENSAYYGLVSKYGTFGQSKKNSKFTLNQNAMVFLTHQEDTPSVGQYTKTINTSSKNSVENQIPSTNHIYIYIYIYIYI